MKERLTAFAKEITEKNPLGVVLRHSVREEIVDHREPWLANLTEEGREWARLLGTLLPVNRKVCFFSSPIERCVETASLIGAGLASVGGEVLFVQPVNSLADMFADSVEASLDAVQELTPKTFFTEWVNESIKLANSEDDFGPIIPIKEAKMISIIEARRKFREELFAIANPNCLNIFLTHDYHLNILRDDYKSLVDPNFDWPPLLGGFVLDPKMASILTPEKDDKWRMS